MLELCAWNPRTQSWLVRKMGVNTRTIKEILDFLLVRKLIDKNPGENGELFQYLTTETGKEALKQYYLLVSKFFIKSD